MDKDTFFHFLSNRLRDDYKFYHIQKSGDKFWIVHFFSNLSNHKFCITRYMEYKGVDFKVKFYTSDNEADIDEMKNEIDNICEEIRYYVDSLGF